MDSASWIEPSIAVSTTGTATAAQDRGPRGRQPRSRCASVTAAKEAPSAGTRLSDAASALPVRDSTGGSASMISSGRSRSENGATASMAAASVTPVDAPKASASAV